MQNFESTYALLVRSEEKKRNALEIVVYALFNPQRGLFDLAVCAPNRRVPD